MKACRTCDVYKKKSQFYKLKKSPDGFHPDCKGCCKVSRSLEAVRRRDKTSKVSTRQRVRAMNMGVEFDRDITLAGIFKIARGICHLCDKWVPPGKASMDHVKALSRGGTHTHDNVRLAHLRCNLVKGNR